VARGDDMPRHGVAWRTSREIAGVGQVFGQPEWRMPVALRSRRQRARRWCLTPSDGHSRQHALACIFARTSSGRWVRDDARIGEGEIFGDDAAPDVGFRSESNCMGLGKVSAKGDFPKQAEMARHSRFCDDFPRAMSLLYRRPGRARVRQNSRASGVSTDHEIVTPTAAMNFQALRKRFPVAVEGVLSEAKMLSRGVSKGVVHGGPGTYVRPQSDFGWDDKDGRRARLASGRLQDGVVHGKCFAVWEDGA